MMLLKSVTLITLQIDGDGKIDAIESNTVDRMATAKLISKIIMTAMGPKGDLDGDTLTNEQEPP
ncbi:MAG: hypothetical protein R2865_09595 [Deinococcales bacterium]